MNTANSEKGITLQLSGDAVDSLRQVEARRQGVIAWRDQEATTTVADKFSTIENHNAGEIGQVQLVAKRQSTSGNSSQLLLSPPPHLPLVLVVAAKLVGYTPTTSEEHDAIKEQVQSVLYKCSSGNDNDDNNNNNGGDSIEEAVYFDERVCEMFDNGVAVHSDTAQFEEQQQLLLQQEEKSELGQQYRYIPIDYPDFIVDRVDHKLYSTAKLWKCMTTSDEFNGIDVVARLLNHLRNCNRSLLWKHALFVELVEHLVPNEIAAKQSRQDQRELHAWRTARRREQLARLYQVRETMEHRLQMEQDKLNQLETSLDAQVAAALRQGSRSTTGLEAFDLNNTVFHFPVGGDGIMDSTILGVRDDDISVEENEYNTFADDDYLDESDDDSTRDNSRDVIEAGDANHVDANATNDNGGCGGMIKRSDISKRRQTSKDKYHRFLEEAKESDYKAKLELAKAKEADTREHLTTNAHKIQIALVISLTDRLQQTDDLLENMQEDEWKDEEGNEDDNGDDVVKIVADTGDASDKVHNGNSEFTLLDQILAMILGATSFSDSSSEVERFAWMKREHEQIVSDWKSYFGRLPTNTEDDEVDHRGLSTHPEPSEQYDETEDFLLEFDEKVKIKLDLGIVDNDDEEWD